ncbi:MAG: hypothetical protein ACREXW_04660 [Gammaproteobacteria bacterium]
MSLTKQRAAALAAAAAQAPVVKPVRFPFGSRGGTGIVETLFKSHCARHHSAALGLEILMYGRVRPGLSPADALFRLRS